MKVVLPLTFVSIVITSARSHLSYIGLLSRPTHSSTTTILNAGLRDLVGEFPEDGSFSRPPYVPSPPFLRDPPRAFEFTPFVDSQSFDRSYVNRLPNPRDLRSYESDNIVSDTRNTFDRVARFFDNNPRETIPSAVRARRQGQLGGPDGNDYRSNFNGNAASSRRPRDGSNQRVVNDNLNPPGRSPVQLARMYNNLEEGNSNFNSLTVVEKYFEAWNRRNVPLALSCFDENIYYDDTQFSKPFEGKDELAKHLIYVADCVPDSFRFVVDGISVGPAVRRRNNRREIDKARGMRNFQQSFNRGRSVTSNRSSSSYERSSSASLVNVGALWHVENENGPLPFARGCSFYMVNPNTNLIVEGYDFPEPAVIKPGSIGLKILSVASKLIDEPIRFVPFVVWVTYIWVVFFSNGILPGKDALQFEARTWEEVRALSLNFFYVAPILGLKLSPSVHPCLEAVFNTLLAWAFLFAGFLSDDRTGAGSDDSNRSSVRYYEKLTQRQEEILDDGRVVIPPVSVAKRNLLPFLPTVIGMQFLTSAFLLPYLFSRTSERSLVSPTAEMRRPRTIIARPLYKEELDKPARIIGEWKGLGIMMGAVGILGLYWFFNGRVEEFGPPLWESPKRLQSFMKLLSVDRVGSSFIVDLIILGLFQGWLVDDDWKRRGLGIEDERFLRNVAKFVPFWGLACYLTFRPGFPSQNDDIADFNSRDARKSSESYGIFRNNYAGDFINNSRGMFNRKR